MGGEEFAVWYLFSHVTVIVMQHKIIKFLTEAKKQSSGVVAFTQCQKCGETWYIYMKIEISKYRL